MAETMLGIDELVDPETLEGLDGRELAELFKRLEQMRRRAEGALAAVIGVVSERNVYRGDGHSSVNAWCRALGRWSDAECRDRIRTANLIRSCDRFASGVVAVRSVLLRRTSWLGCSPTRVVARSWWMWLR